MNTYLALVLAGISVGVLGSFHCVGMCGPIAFNLPLHTHGGGRRMAATLLYLFGKTTAYATLGFLVGLLGQGFSFFEVQQGLSVVAGALVLILLWLYMLGSSGLHYTLPFTQVVQRRLGQFLRNARRIRTYFAIGLLNGLLPCGLVYVAMATALAGGNATKSGLFMWGFGVGTSPIMLFMLWFGGYVPMSWRNMFQRLTPYFMGVVGVLLILRGLNLGIPYISPFFRGQSVAPVCH